MAQIKEGQSAHGARERSSDTLPEGLRYVSVVQRPPPHLIKLDLQLLGTRSLPTPSDPKSNGKSSPECAPQGRKRALPPLDPKRKAGSRSPLPRAAPGTSSPVHLYGSSWTAPTLRRPSRPRECACASSLRQAPALSRGSRHSNRRRCLGNGLSVFGKQGPDVAVPRRLSTALPLRGIMPWSRDFRNPAGRTRLRDGPKGLQGCPGRSPGVPRMLQACPDGAKVPLVESPPGWDFQAQTTKAEVNGWNCITTERFHKPQKQFQPTEWEKMSLHTTQWRVLSKWGEKKAPSASPTWLQEPQPEPHLCSKKMP
ncbi:uncharacterized protein LOC135276329 [Aotus nancymaae]|uniref:uncharacterized protein LOC135276329 n=1 Tax=Aotus nancymaae TaxID=37293 RepID=UPI0030FE66BF